MCGIAGAFSLDRPIHEQDIREVRHMTALLRHRGPDTIDFFQDEYCVLGNTRLRIIDLSDNAALPMPNEDRTVWIVYNGEVTNFRELKKQFQLEEKHVFCSTSDTEVLVHLYEELGISFLDHLSGQFAFCLYDLRAGKAWLVRDQYGIRPLFSMIAGDRLYFSSEIKSFVDLERFHGQVDREAIYHFFSLAYIPDRLTPFSQVREVQGGCLIEIDLKKKTHEEREYYTVRYDTDFSITEENVVERLHQEMLDSVRRNLISDAPLGLTLSGGFDTSSILTLAKELGVNRELHTFSIVMDEPSFDESYYQRVMVDFARPIHHQVIVGADEVLSCLETHMAYLDEPNGDGAAIPSYLLAEDAAKYVRVLLSGEGGDETFNAYETHLAYKVRKLYRKSMPRPVRDAVARMVHLLPCSYEKLSFDFVAKRFVEGTERGTPEAHFHWRHVLSEEFKKELMPGSDGYRPTDSFFTDLFHSLDFPDELNRISLIDLKYFFIGDLMVKNDRMIMAHSIEARFPFMDRLLLEFVSRIPTSLRIKGLKRRYIQKQAMRGYIPTEIYRRSNMGLEMPHSIWFTKGLKAAAEKYFTKEHVERSGLLHYPTVRQMWETHMSRKCDMGRALWCVLMFLIWFDLFVYNKDFKGYLR